MGAIRQHSVEWERVVEAKAVQEALAWRSGATQPDEKALLEEVVPGKTPSAQGDLARRGSKDWDLVVAHQAEKAVVAEISEAARASPTTATLMLEFKKISAGSLLEVSERVWAQVAADALCTLDREVPTGTRRVRAFLLSGGGTLVLRKRRVVLVQCCALSSLQRLLDLCGSAARVAAVVYSQRGALGRAAERLPALFPQGEAADLGPVSVFVANRLPSDQLSEYVYAEVLPAGNTWPDPRAVFREAQPICTTTDTCELTLSRGFYACVHDRDGVPTLATDVPQAEDELRATLQAVIGGGGATVFLFSLSPLLGIHCPAEIQGPRHVADKQFFASVTEVTGLAETMPTPPLSPGGWVDSRWVC